MMSMMVPQYGDASVLEHRDRSPQPLDPTAVRIDVDAVGVNFADIEQRRGRYRGGPEPPFVPGLEGAGTITECGSAVEAWSSGDEVMCFFPQGGGYAETAVTDAAYVFPQPQSVSTVEAGGLLVQAFTAHNALYEWGGLTADQTVLINAAAGGVGSMATQLAAAEGATVIGTASTASKREFAADCGATHTIDYTTADVPGTVADLTDRGVDLVLDGVGGSAFADGIKSLAPGGTLVTYGSASGELSTVVAPRLFYQNKSVVGYHLMNGIEERPESVFAAREPLLDRLASGAVSVTVEDTYPLSAASAAHRAIEGRETKGRVVLEP